MRWVVVVALVLASNFAGNVTWGTHALESEFFDCQLMICQNVKNYPEDEINEAVERQHHSLKSLLGGTVFNATSEFVIGNRIKPFSEAESSQLCNVYGPTTYRPRKMRNTMKDAKVVVNTEKYRQLITVEACRALASPYALTTSETCTDIFHNNCRQIFQPLSLLTYEDGKIQFDNFLVPSSCKCCEH